MFWISQVRMSVFNSHTYPSPTVDISSSLYLWFTDLWVKLDLKTYFPLISIFNIFTQLQAKNGIQEMECCSLESDWIYFHPDASGRIIHVGPNQVKWVFLFITLKWKVAFRSIYWHVYFCQPTVDSIIEIITLLYVVSSETGI